MPRNLLLVLLLLLLLMWMRFQEVDPPKPHCEVLKRRVYIDFSHVVL